MPDRHKYISDQHHHHHPHSHHSVIIGGCIGFATGAIQAMLREREYSGQGRPRNISTHLSIVLAGGLIGGAIGVTEAIAGHKPWPQICSTTHRQKK